MAGVSHIDEIIDYKKKIIDTLGSSQAVVGLILDDPNIDMGSDTAYSVFDDNLFDYNYVDATQTQASALIMVEVEVPRIPTDTVKDMMLYIQTVVSKDFMQLKSNVFNGVSGNRRDNITRQVDLLLNNSRDFGIGRLKLERVMIANVPDGYTSTMLTYSVPEFAKDRRLGNG